MFGDYSCLVARGIQHFMNTAKRLVEVLLLGGRMARGGLEVSLKQQEVGFDVKVR